MYKSILLAADGSENSLRSAKEVLNHIDEFSKIDIKNILEKIAEIEETLYQRNE